jgi:polyferredoxin
MVQRNRTLGKFFWLLPAVLLMAGVVWAQEEASHKAPGFFDVWLVPRVWMSAIFALLGLVLMIQSWVRRHLRTIALAVIFFVFAILWALPLGNFARGMGVHPSPECIIAKPFFFLKAGRGIPIFFLSLFTSIAILTVVGNKLFCGWVCPIGAIQELANRIKTRKFRLPFRITNWIRIGLFVAFLVVAFAAEIETYAYFNPFETLHWGLAIYGLAVLLVVIVAGVFLFRPFCYLICPMGLFTWVFEHLSLVRVRLDKSECTECNLCVDDSYCPAMPAILELKKSRPDCHSCGRCIEICPEEAIRFK